MAHSDCGRTCGCAGKLWDPLRTRAIPERFLGDEARRGAISVYVLYRLQTVKCFSWWAAERVYDIPCSQWSPPLKGGHMQLYLMAVRLYHKWHVAPCAQGLCAQGLPVTTVQSAQYNTEQYSTVQYRTVQYSTIHYSRVHHSTMQHSTVQCSVVQYSTAQYNTLQHSTSMYNAAQYSTIQYSTIQ